MRRVERRRCGLEARAPRGIRARAGGAPSAPSRPLSGERRGKRLSTALRGRSGARERGAADRDNRRRMFAPAGARR